MKKLFSSICLIFIFIVSLSTFSACNKDAHCPAYNGANAKTDKNKNLSTKPGKSNLFPKGM